MPPPSFLDGRGDTRRDGGQQDTRYRDEPRRTPSRDEPRQPASRGESLPYIPPAHAGGYPGDEQRQYGAQSSPYGGDNAHDDYDEEASAPRRSGTVVVLAILGLAVLGVAGALGYRTMFGSPLIPQLPPIIKPGDTPIKIMPNQQAQAGAPGQADAGGGGTGEQLVPHQETPVDVQSANPAPRVVTTIPVISNAPDAPLPGGQSSAASEPAPTLPPAPSSAFAEPNNAGPPPGAPDQLTAPPPQPRAPGSKAVHTVIIRPGQPPAAAPDPAADEAPAVAPPSHPVRAHATRPAGVPTASGGPLSIIPGQQQDTQPLPRTRTALAHSPAPMPLNNSPSAEAAPSLGGGYAVQVTSQRSEADAQAAFRALQGKYPQQLGGRRAIIRRADLGAKGVYYRALVGPFASGEQAAGLCTSLKAAGGNCILQRD
jgi:cell division septation protein DedD